MPRKRILFIGGAQIRFAVGTARTPAPGEVIRSEANYTFAPCGRSILGAIASARLGYDTAVCARVGDDYYGDRLREVCKKEGLHSTNVTVDRTLQTGLALELVEQSGVCRTILFPGANRGLGKAHAENALACLPDAIVASLETEPEAVVQVSALAAERGIPFFVDATAKRGMVPADFPFEQLARAEILLLDEEDAYTFSGVSPINEEQRKLACYTLRKRFDVRYILLRLGARGCFLYDGKYFSAISAFDEEPVDPAGASEAFTAALIGEYLNTGDLRAGAEFANNVYAKTASVPGGYRSLPRRSEL
ncbi:MAG: hypothetical protein J1E00_00130 [Oscillospiraceae bacterium]|nr:hypothetical protein [Oscillospiraceae bacterium]